MMMGVFEFTYSAFFLLLPFPWLMYRFAPAYSAPQSALHVPFLQRLLSLSQKELGLGAVLVQRVLFQRLWLGLSWLLLITALAKPVLLGEPIQQQQSTTDLMMLVDLSASMQATDFSVDETVVDRLVAVKQVLASFSEQRQYDRLGLIVFADNAYLQVPFTADHQTFLNLLGELEIGMAGQQTRFGDAIGLAIKLFDESDKKNRVLLALTDGNDTGSRVPPVEAAKVAAQKNVRIYTIAMGDPASVGEQALDEKSLQRIADVTGGQYYQAIDTAGLVDIYSEIDELEKEAHSLDIYQPKQDVYHWPLAAIVVVYLLFHALMLWNNYSRIRALAALKNTRTLNQSGGVNDD